MPLFHQIPFFKPSFTSLGRLSILALLLLAAAFSARAQVSVVSTNPAPGAVVEDLYFINVVFNTSVTGVTTNDLRVNNTMSFAVATNNPNDYTFYYARPATGLVQVAWIASHGIRFSSSQTFGGGSWTYTLAPDPDAAPSIVISEFLAQNSNGIRDEDGTRQDWIELYNPGPLQINLQGWFLTDEKTNLTQWPLPDLTLSPNKYLLVWASGKNRTNPAAALHANFKLDKDGGFLALVNSRTNIISSFDPYPAQQADHSYGRDRIDPDLMGFFTTPTPGAQNTLTGSGFVPAPGLSLESGIYTNNSLTLVITSAPGTTVRYTVNGESPTATSTLYSGPITITGSYTIKARAFKTGTTLFPSTIVSRQFILLDSTTRDFTSRLPILVISTGGAAIPESVLPGQPRRKGSFFVCDTINGQAKFTLPRDFQGLAEFEIFGQTSASFPKKPYNIEIQDELGNDIDASLLGMPADADWKLRNPYTDKCLMNDFLAYELFEQMGRYSCRRRFVEVFVDTSGGKLSYPADYSGVLVLLEKIEQGDNRVNIARLASTQTNEPAISGGYMFKKDKDSAGDLAFYTSGGAGFSGQTLKLHEPKPRDVNNNANHPQVVWLRKYLNLMEQAMYSSAWLTQTGTNHYSHYLDVDAFVDQHWIVEFPKQIDGYRLSDYFNKDRGGKVKPEPIWDWNLSFGNADYLDGGHYSGWYYNQPDMSENAHIWQRRLINGTTAASGVGDPNYCQKIADRWGELRTNVFNGPRLLARIDEIAALLSEAADRDFARFPRLGTYIWPNPSTPAFDVNYVTPTTYAGIISEMKKWVAGRYNWVDGQFTLAPAFDAAPGLVSKGTVLTLSVPAGATNYYTVDGTDPRASGGGLSSKAVRYTGPITVNANVCIFARARKSASASWQATWSPPVIGAFYTAIPALRITELMFNPLPPGAGNTNEADNFEYIEVKNIGTTALNVSGFQLGGGVAFTFPNVVLAAGQTAVIVKNIAAFQSRYGSSALILGAFAGSLASSGDRLVLEGSRREPILDFSYNDKWYPAADGFGFSLVVQDEQAPAASWNSASQWRPSAALGGSPGANDPAPPTRPVVLISEVLSHPTPPGLDAIELHNPGPTAANVSGWFLTDDFRDPAQFIIPPDAIIPPGGYITFTEANFNTGANAFALSSKGEEVYLFSGDSVNLTGYAHGFDFGAAAADVTFGRYVISTGEDHFVAQAANTLGNNNAGPRVGPVVISEIMYHPAEVIAGSSPFNNTEDEFIELRNYGASPAPLYDPAYPTNTWRLRDAVSFDFPASVTLPAGGALLVVGFDPALYPDRLAGFRARNLVPAATPVYGPWQGHLDNQSGRVELSRPRVPESNGEVNYVLVERVSYQDAAPWPVAADGLGLSLQRIVETAYGNDPTNWVAAASSAGARYIAGAPPVLTSQPGDRIVFVGDNVQLTASATGAAPLRYQWRFQGLNLPDATNSTLWLTDIQGAQSGVYNILVYNRGGYALGTNFTLDARVQLRITKQPQDAVAVAASGTNFSVQAIGTGALRYQWQKDSTNIPNATNYLLPLSNIQVANEGTYRVIVSDDVDSLISDPATLTVVTRPSITTLPLGITVPEGGTAVFSAAAGGTLPITFRWRTNAVMFTNGLFLTTPTNTFLILTNVSMTWSNVRFSVVVSNVASQTASSSAVLKVLTDADRDGLPDSWEDEQPGFNSNDPADGARDNDGDGLTNAEEYLAGTDYLDASSKLNIILDMTDGAQLRFAAVSNRTYAVQFSDALSSDQWRALANLIANKTTAETTIADPVPATNRFYRIVTPVQP